MRTHLAWTMAKADRWIVSPSIWSCSALRTRTLSEMRGFLKALISAESDEILGFTALGTQAGELMAVVQIAMLAKLTYTVLRDAILTHPTMAEGLITLFAAVPPIRG